MSSANVPMSDPASGRRLDDGAVPEPNAGSDLYYSLLWTPADGRHRFLARRSLIHAIATTLHDVHDAGVAEQKIHWWHEELERLLKGQARHPSAIACMPTLEGVADASRHLLDVLSVAASIRFEAAATDAIHRERLERDQQARLALLAHALSARPADLATDAFRFPELGFALGLRADLARLPTLLHRGYAVFSDARYARHGLTPEVMAQAIQAPVGDGGPSALVTEAVEEAHGAITRARAATDYRHAMDQPALLPLVRLHALRAHELGLWRDKQPDLLRERTVATPLRRFFIAWRNRHKAH